MNFEKRLSELERAFHGGEVTLRMPDGSSRVIRLGRGQDLADLFVRCLSDPDCEEARLIAQSIGAEEGTGRTIEMIKAVQEPVDLEIVR